MMLLTFVEGVRSRVLLSVSFVHKNHSIFGVAPLLLHLGISGVISTENTEIPHNFEIKRFPVIERALITGAHPTKIPIATSRTHDV